MLVMTDQAAPAKPGRKRSEDSRLAILRAALELVGELGYNRLTIEGIAARSGAGKQTVYRWWPSKADVLLEALATKADLFIPIPDEGRLADDLRAFLAASFALARRREVVDVLRALMAEAQVNAEFGERFRAGFLQRRRDALCVILDRGAERGELRSGLSVTTTADIVFGVIWYRILATRESFTDGLTEELITALTA
jgi:AcrR family transcriptional regulator